MIELSRTLAAWTRQHREEIEAAREAFDLRGAPEPEPVLP